MSDIAEQIESFQNEAEGLREVQADYEAQIATIETEKQHQASQLDREFLVQQEELRELSEENRFLRNDIANLQADLQETNLIIDDMKQDVCICAAL